MSSPYIHVVREGQAPATRCSPRLPAAAAWWEAATGSGSSVCTPACTPPGRAPSPCGAAPHAAAPPAAGRTRSAPPRYCWPPVHPPPAEPASSILATPPWLGTCLVSNPPLLSLSAPHTTLPRPAWHTHHAPAGQPAAGQLPNTSALPNTCGRRCTSDRAAYILVGRMVEMPRQTPPLRSVRRRRRWMCNSRCPGVLRGHGGFSRGEWALNDFKCIYAAAPRPRAAVKAHNPM